MPANGSLELKPGGAHLMFVDLKAPFRQGGKVPATLREPCLTARQGRAMSDALRPER